MLFIKTPVQYRKSVIYYLKLFFGLSILNPIGVIDCFTDDFMAVRPTGDARVLEFIDYVFDNN